MTTQEFDLRAIALALSIDKRSAERRAKNGGWDFREISVVGGKRRLYALKALPQDVQAAVLLHSTDRTELPVYETVGGHKKNQRHAPTKYSEQSIKSIWERFERVPQKLKTLAHKRLRTLLALEQLILAGTPVMDARAIIADQLLRDGEKGASPASVARLQKLVAGAHRSDWLAVLIPQYAGRTATAEISPQAWETFKADWLRLEAPSATSCYGRLVRTAKANGWEIPSLRTIERRIERELPPSVIVLARQGEEKMLRMFPAQQRDRSVFHALEAVNADGHRFDVFVRFPDGSIGRPMLVGWQDLYSGKILSHRLGDNECSDMVRLSFADMVNRYGIPRGAWLDNGRSFAAKMLTGGSKTRYRFKVLPEDPEGVFTTLGCETHWVTPYHGQAKPIERAWRDFCDTIAKHPAFAGAYTGNSPAAKPENYGSAAVEFEVFAAVVADEIAAHNAREGRRSKVCAGRSFDATFAASYAISTIRKATEEQQRLMLLAAESVFANRTDGSVTLSGNRYWCESLSRHAGQKLVLRFDPLRLQGSVFAYTLDNVYVGEAECIATVGFADTNAAREHARAKRNHRTHAKGMLDAERRMDAASVAAQLPATPPENLPAAGVIAAVFGQRGPRPAPAPAPVAEAKRTGTDDAPYFDPLDEMLKRRQAQQIHDMGWQPPE